MQRLIRHYGFSLAGAALLALALLGCDQGVSPESETGPALPPYGIRGAIAFRHWPPQDSIRDLRLVAFRTYPPGDIATEITQGRARFTETLQPYNADTIRYTLTLAPMPPGTLALIAVAQQYGPNIQTDWRMVGFYTTASGGRDSVIVPADSIVPGINLNVDFQNPPDMP